MQIEATALEGVFVITPTRHHDDRGFFSESWNRNDLERQGLRYDFVQDNHSLSFRKGTLRGLHFQLPPYPQAKLVRCGQGALLDVVVDIRRHSPTYRHWIAEKLSAENGRQILIPRGFAHGFVTLEDNTEIIYKCDNPYSRVCDRAIMFDDPELDIEWGWSRDRAILSEKDASAPPLADIDIPTEWDGAP